MAQKHDNQYTAPPLTEAEVKAKAAKIFRIHAKGPNGWDRMALFAEWIRTDPEKFKNTNQWVASIQDRYPGLHPQSIQDWGGKLFWRQARQSVRAKALEKVIAKTPDLIEKKYEKQLRIVSKLEDALEHRIDSIRKDQQNEANPGSTVNPFELSAIETLIEGVEKLAKTNVLLSNDGIEKHDIRTVNLHASLVEAIKQRDSNLGVSE